MTALPVPYMLPHHLNQPLFACPGTVPVLAPNQVPRDVPTWVVHAEVAVTYRPDTVDRGSRTIVVTGHVLPTKYVLANQYQFAQKPEDDAWYVPKPKLPGHW